MDWYFKRYIFQNEHKAGSRGKERSSAGSTTSDELINRLAETLRGSEQIWYLCKVGFDRILIFVLRPTTGRRSFPSPKLGTSRITDEFYFCSDVEDGTDLVAPSKSTLSCRSAFISLFWHFIAWEGGAAAPPSSGFF